MHRLLFELARAGVAILMISSETPEVLRVADRVLVMREGRLVAELGHEEATEHAVVAAATGQQDAAAFKVGADHTVLLGPPFVFDKANINKFNF